MTDHALTLRAAAAQSALDEWLGQRLRFGHADCVRMTASHLRRLGYAVKLPPRGSYRSVRSALAQLARFGHASIPDAVGALGIARIAPAYAIIGDIVELPSAVPGLAALTIAVGNGRVLGWHDTGQRGAVVMQPHALTAAWRAEPRVG